jgi:hypothetical protein
VIVISDVNVVLSVNVSVEKLSLVAVAVLVSVIFVYSVVLSVEKLLIVAVVIVVAVRVSTILEPGAVNVSVTFPN